MFKITKSLNNNYVLSLRDTYGTKAIAKIATPDELIEAREWVEKFYEGDYKIEALKDLTQQVLKYRNGAVVYAPEHKTLFWYLDLDNAIRSTYYVHVYPKDKKRLEDKNLFLTKEEAEAYLEKLKIYNKLEKKITIINHENNWEADWSDGENKYYLYLNHANNEYRYTCCWRHQQGVYYMCKQAINWLLSDEVSDEERKIWIEGV